MPSRRRVGVAVIAIIAVLLIAVVLLWNWDWFIPIVEARASAAIGRRVSISHLHVRLGRSSTATADDVVVANPDGFAQAAPLAHLAHLSVVVDVMAYWHGRGLVLPLITVDRPDIAATALSDGRNNFTLAFDRPGGRPTAAPQIGELQIIDGHARVVDPKLRADFALGMATRAARAGSPGAIVVDAHGTYAGQKIVGHFVGGALLTLRDAAHPYPIDLALENGATRVALVGTVQNPLNFAGARLRLKLSGTDMSALYPLTGIPIPPSPPYSLAGNLDYARPKIRFTDFAGRVGASDLNGDLAEDPGIGGKPDVTMNLWSHRVDLADLGGLIGTPPGRVSTPGQTPAQKAALKQVEAKKTLLPDTPINLPKLRSANLHLTYRGEHIENRYTPFDKLALEMDLVDGRITLHPLNVAVGTGRIASNIDLAPGANDVVAARADIQFQHINLSRVLRATHAFQGEGILGGEARIVTNGNSLASMMGQGNGEVKLVLLGGGNLSALLVDITGLEFGNALLSALGVPNRAEIQCFVTDLPLTQGILRTRAFLLDTSEGRVTGNGSLNFRDQSLDFSLTTRSKHFSIGSLPGPIDITGPLGAPRIRPGAETVARAGAATGLGILLTPLGALLPTIQFGVGDDNACTRATAAERQPLRVPHPAQRRVHK